MSSETIKSGQADVSQRVRAMLRKEPHTRECDRFNNHSHGEHDFVESPYHCICWKKKVEDALRGEVR